MFVWNESVRSDRRLGGLAEPPPAVGGRAVAESVEETGAVRAAFSFRLQQTDGHESVPARDAQSVRAGAEDGSGKSELLFAPSFVSQPGCEQPDAFSV